MSAELMPPLIQSLTLKAGMGLPSSAACSAREAGSLSQVQSSGNSPARVGSVASRKIPKATKNGFGSFIRHQLSQPIRAGNGENQTDGNHVIGRAAIGA